MVVCASRGLGRGIATAFAEAGAPVVAVARTAAPVVDPTGDGGIQQEVADAADATVAASLLNRWKPGAIILVAGASPLMRPLSAPDLGGVLGQLARRCADRVPLVTRGPAQAAATWQQDDRDQQRVPRCKGHRSAVATRAPRPPSALSPPTPKRRQAAAAWTSPLPRFCPESRR